MSDDIRAIYLRLVKLVHTDTAPMDEFSVRTMTMQILNDAYKRRDLGALRALEAKMPSPVIPQTENVNATPHDHKEAATSRVTPKTDPGSGDRNATLSKLHDLWPDIRADLKFLNRRIDALFQQIELVAFRNATATVILASQYDFHRNRTNTAEIRSVVEAVISRRLGEPVSIMCVPPDSQEE